jgi:hypothetical protein
LTVFVAAKYISAIKLNKTFFVEKHGSGPSKHSSNIFRKSCKYANWQVRAKETEIF